jgi:pimeloyl-ACP methyl ester carboxylesterase
MENGWAHFKNRQASKPRSTLGPLEFTMRYLIGLVLSFSLSLSAATVDGLKIHSTTYASTTGTGQQTVFLVHGWTCDETTWTEQVPALTKQYRVVTLDLPGHGKSDSPKDGKFSMDLFARAIEAVRAEVNADHIVLAGHSMGTPVVLRYARLYPQHTAALVFVDGLMPTGAASPNAGMGAVMGGPGGHAIREGMIRGFFSASTTPSMQAKILNMMLAAPEATAVGAMNATFDAAGQTEDIPKIPTLGLYAGPSSIATREAVLAHFPNTEYTQIPGTGHFLMLEKPEEFNRLLLAFLAKQKY